MLNMKFSVLCQKYAIALAITGVLASPTCPAMAVESPQVQPANKPSAPIADVKLAPGGVLRGQVIGKDGTARPGVAVAVLQNGRQIAGTTADAQGRFAVADLKGGLYLVATDRSAGAVRAWTHQTAPPSATSAIMLVPDDGTLRGQDGTVIGNLLTNPGVWIVGGAMGAILYFSVEDPAS
jgi:hypothetical protein